MSVRTSPGQLDQYNKKVSLFVHRSRINASTDFSHIVRNMNSLHGHHELSFISRSALNYEFHVNEVRSKKFILR